MSIGRMMPVEFRAPKTSANTTTCTRLMPGNPALEMPMPRAPATASAHCASLRDVIGSRDYVDAKRDRGHGRSRDVDRRGCRLDVGAAGGARRLAAFQSRQ